MSDFSERFNAADGLRIGLRCDGNFQIELLDQAETIFAVAVLTPDQLAEHIRQCSRIAEHAKSGDDLALMTPGGRA